MQIGLGDWEVLVALQEAGDVVVPRDVRVAIVDMARGSAGSVICEHGVRTLERRSEGQPERLAQPHDEVSQAPPELALRGLRHGSPRSWMTCLRIRRHQASTSPC